MDKVAISEFSYCNVLLLYGSWEKELSMASLLMKDFLFTVHNKMVLKPFLVIAITT